MNEKTEETVPGIRVLYEDRHIAVVEKPVGVLAEGTSPAPAKKPAASPKKKKDEPQKAPSAGTSGIRKDSGTPDIVSLLAQRAGTPDGEDAWYAPVHRLDCAVGGAMALAKKPYAAAVLSEALRERGENVKKEYLCIVSGVFSEKEGTLRDLLIHDARQNKTFIADRMRAGVREAVLSYRVLAEASCGGSPISLLCVTLGTGRSHQIRVQFSSRSHPILCDGKYGGRRPAGAEGGGIALWSFHLAIPHPVNLSRTADGRRENPNAPRFPDIDAYSLPQTDALPWSLFAETLDDLRRRFDIR